MVQVLRRCNCQCVYIFFLLQEKKERKTTRPACLQQGTGYYLEVARDAANRERVNDLGKKVGRQMHGYYSKQHQSHGGNKGVMGS